MARKTAENDTETMAQVNVLARNCEVETELREHFEEKLGGLQRLWPKTTEINVRVSEERGRYTAEVTLISGGLITRSEERAGNLRQAFDNAAEKLEGQLKRYKQKARARKRRHDNRDDVAGTVLNPTLPHNGVVPVANSTISLSSEEETDDSATDETQGDELVRVKRFALKPMSPEEAALQMDLLGHSFFVFRDAENDQVSVVYRRRSGGYGLIEPVAD